MKPVGVLDVKLVQARDLKNKDMVGKSDPFALVYIRPLRNTTRKSKTIVSNRVVNQLSEILTSQDYQHNTPLQVFHPGFVYK